MERLNKEASAETTPSESSPTPPRCCACQRGVPIETHNEWQVSDRRYLSEASMSLLTQPAPSAIIGTATEQEVTDTEVLRTA